jgi:predicted enzyme related to lactoylglutathione lyase
MTVELLVNVDVDDLERATNFYTTTFGLTAGRSFGADGVELLGASSRLYLLVKPSGSRAVGSITQSRDYRRHWTPVHLDFVVPDIELTLERALGAGAVLEAALTTHAWGSIALLADPFGHGFCLIQFSEQGYDAVAVGPPPAACRIDPAG